MNHTYYVYVLASRSHNLYTCVTMLLGCCHPEPGRRLLRTGVRDLLFL